MGRTTKNITVKTDDKPDPEEIEIGEYLKGIAGSGVIVKLFSIDRFSKQAFVEDLPLEAIQAGGLESFIREEYGGGSYMIRVVRDGKFLKGCNKTIHIAESKDAVAAPVVQNENTKLIELQVQMMKDSADRTFQMMQMFNTSIMGVLTAMITSNKPMDPIQLATLLKDGSNPTGQFAMVKEMVSLAKELSPGGAEPEDPWLKVLTMVPQILGNRTAAAPAQIPAEIPKNPPPTPVVERTVVEAQPMDERKRFLLQLKEKAKSGKDVEFWADYIEENADEPGPAVVIGFVRMYPWEDVFGSLCQADPELAQEPCKSWFEKLYLALKEPAAEEQQ